MVKLVGILNLTPDSFSDGGRYNDFDAAVRHAESLFADGAALIDIGAESTRPNAVKLTHQQEWQRLEPVLEHLLKQYPDKISLDTYHPETAEKALRLAPVIINDVTGMNNPAMVDVVIKYGAGCIVSHLPGMDVQAAHQGRLISDIQQVYTELIKKAVLLESRGLARNRIILDPGIGFGKTPELNQQLLQFVEMTPEYAVMIGYSRKRFLGKDRLSLAPNLVAGKIAIEAKATYLRVHDVAGHRQLL